MWRNGEAVSLTTSMRSPNQRNHTSEGGGGTCTFVCKPLMSELCPVESTLLIAHGWPHCGFLSHLTPTLKDSKLMILLRLLKKITFLKTVSIDTNSQWQPEPLNSDWHWLALAIRTTKQLDRKYKYTTCMYNLYKEHISKPEEYVLRGMSCWHQKLFSDSRCHHKSVSISRHDLF